MSKQILLSTIAGDSLDELQVAREHAGSLESLGWAISASLKAGHDHHAKRLASLVSYLSHEYHSILDSEITRLSKQLEAADSGT